MGIGLGNASTQVLDPSCAIYVYLPLCNLGYVVAVSAYEDLFCIKMKKNTAGVYLEYWDRILIITLLQL